MKKILTSLCVMLAVFVAPGTQAASLQSLFDGDSMTVGDKLFDNWTLIAATDSFFGPAMDLNQIEVTGLAGDPLNIGLRFDANGQLKVAGLDFLDLNFSFDITAVVPGFMIKEVSLAIAEHNVVGLKGLVLIEETVSNTAGDEIAFMDAFVDNLFLDEKLSDSVEFDLLKTLTVEKNILVFGDDIGDVVELISFEQHFAQAEVPEPSSLALMALGLVGFRVVSNRKSVRQQKHSVV